MTGFGRKLLPLMLYPVCILLLQFAAGAQSTTFQCGFSTPVAAQLGLFGRSGSRYSLIGAAGISATGRTNGTDERAFCWQQHIGLLYNQVSYKVQSGDFLHAELYNFVLEPEVLLPTRKEHLHISVGIGIYYAFFVDAAAHSGTSSSRAFYSNVDSFGDVLEHNSRSLLPFISAGLVYQLSSRYQVGCKLRQVLRNRFEQGASTTYYINQEPHSLALSYQPTFLELSFTYFLKNKEK